MNQFKNLIGNLSEQVYFPRVFLKLVGTHSAAYFLSQVVYWESRMNKEFYRVQAEWEEDGFKEDSLRTAVAKCRKYVTVVKKSIPAKNYYSVNWEALYNDIVSATSDPVTPATGDGDSPQHTITEITQRLAAKAAVYTFLPEDSDTERIRRAGKRVDEPILEVFRVFTPKYPKNWEQNVTQRNSAQNLLREKGLDQIKSAVKFYYENKTNKYCPDVSTPHKLDSKWGDLISFKEKNNL